MTRAMKPKASDKPSVLFDVEYFDSLLNRPDISKEVREETLTELWNLIGMFIDVGWGVHPLPEPEQKNRGELSENPRGSSIAGENVLRSDHDLLKAEFIKTTGLSQKTK